MAEQQTQTLTHEGLCESAERDFTQAGENLNKARAVLVQAEREFTQSEARLSLLRSLTEAGYAVTPTGSNGGDPGNILETE